MSYVVIKTIGNRQYRYLQTSYRVGKKVKTKCVYLGPVTRAGSDGNGMAGPQHFPRFDEEKELQRQRNEKAAYEAMKERFTKEVGLVIGPDNPVPVEKHIPTISFAPSAAPTVQESQAPSGDGTAESTAPAAA